MPACRAPRCGSTRVSRSSRRPTTTAAGLIARYEHADYGQVEQPGAFWIFGDLDVKLDRAPPALGEHTVEVLTEVGLDAATVDALVASGAAHAWKAAAPA